MKKIFLLSTLFLITVYIYIYYSNTKVNSSINSALISDNKIDEHIENNIKKSKKVILSIDDMIKKNKLVILDDKLNNNELKIIQNEDIKINKIKNKLKELSDENFN